MEERAVLENRKITEKSFITPQKCGSIARNFREWAELGGFDGYEDTPLSVDQCENIADQFEAAREKGGAYFSNIIFHPFYTKEEIITILTAI